MLTPAWLKETRIFETTVRKKENRLINQSAQAEFDVRYYRWSLSDAQGELQENLPLLRTVKGPVPRKAIFKVPVRNVFRGMVFQGAANLPCAKGKRGFASRVGAADE